jgi:phage terminase Nu1 subunit (DNA packaging protein)
MGLPTYPVTFVAAVLGVTTRRVQQLAAEGIIAKPERAKYDLVKCVQGYIRFLQERSTVDQSGEQPAFDGKKERARLTKAQADKEELEVAALRGDLVAADQEAAVWTAYLANVRAKLLAIPHKIAPRVLIVTDLAEAQGLIEGEIHECLKELAEGDGIPDQDIEPVEQNGGGFKATTKADSEPVGGQIPSA